MEKLLLSESARASKLRRELSAKPSKTKIVVHINNYILPNEDLTTTSTNNHSMATTRENTDIFELDFPKTEYRFNELNTASENRKKNKFRQNERKESGYMILKAKSLNFPVKIRSSYSIYQTPNNINNNNILDDKLLSIEKNYNIIEKRISNIINYELYKKLPPNTTTANFTQQNEQTNSLKQTFLKDNNFNSLPNYLKLNHNLQPTFSINRVKTDSKLDPDFSYKKLISERSNNLVERFNKIEAIIKKRDKKLSNKKSIKEPDQLPEPVKEIKDKPIQQQQQSLSDESKKITNNTANLKTLEPPNNNKVLLFVNPSIPKKVIHDNSLKLPYIMRSLDPNEFALSLTSQSNETSQSYSNFTEHKQVVDLTDDVDDKINKIIRDYPSIVLRRQSNNKRFPKLKNYLSDNHIKYDISSSSTSSSPLKNHKVVTKSKEEKEPAAGAASINKTIESDEKILNNKEQISS